MKSRTSRSPRIWYLAWLPEPITPAAPVEALPAPVPPVPPGNYYRGTEMRSEVSDGVILDLGEGISLHIPIERRMSPTVAAMQA